MTIDAEIPVDYVLGVASSGRDAGTISIAEILDSYDNWGVPHFQRGSVWTSDNTSALLESLFHDTPCGSIILWTPKDVDQHGVPLIKGRSCSHLIIDGQQRTRSVYAAFKDLFDTTQDATSPDAEGEQNSAAMEGVKHWAINLNEVPEFDDMLHRPEKRLWPMFVAVPDPYRAEKTRLERIQKGRERRRNAQYNIPESPFKYNFIPLHFFTNGDELAPALKERRLFLKRRNGESTWINEAELAILMAKLEQLRLRIQEMKTRRLFLKVLGPDVTLDAALRVFVRINSGGRPVQEEEKGFSVLVGRCPSTSEWVRTIFDAVHAGSECRELSDRNEALKRMQEKNFGFKLFIRVFMLAASYHTNRAISGRSLAFGALQDRRFMPMVQDRPTYDRLWSTTSNVVIASRRLLKRCLNLDALQFLPETTALFPLFLFMVKYPGVFEGEATQDVRVKSSFESGLGRLALIMLLRDLGKQESLAWANEISKSHEDASTLIDRLQRRAAVDASFLDKRLRDANSLSNRYTLLLYALQRRLGARDFNYAANNLAFEHSESQLTGACDPEKQHIVPYSHLIRAYNLEFASRVSTTEANNIGNITYISHGENSLAGLSDELVELTKENVGNLGAHFLAESRAKYEDVKALIEDQVGPEKLKAAYVVWIQSRRAEISKGFLSWLDDLQREWQHHPTERETKDRVEPVAPIYLDLNNGQGRAYALRTLNLPDRIEDALIGMLLEDGWRIQNGPTWQVGEQLVCAFYRKRRTIVSRVTVSRHGLTLPSAHTGKSETIDFTDSELAVRQLNALKDHLAASDRLKLGKANESHEPQKAVRGSTMTRAELLEAVGELQGHAEAFASFVEELAPLGVYPDRAKEGIALRFPDPGGSRAQFRIARVRRNGTARIGLLRGQLEEKGYSTAPVAKQARAIASWLRDAKVDADGALIEADGRRNEVSLSLLMTDRREDYLSVIRELVEDIRKVAIDGSSRE